MASRHRLGLSLLRAVAVLIAFATFALGISVLPASSEIPFAGVFGVLLILFALIAFALIVRSSPSRLTPSFAARVRPYLWAHCALLPVLFLLGSLDADCISPLEWGSVVMAGLVGAVLFIALRSSYSAELAGA